MQQNYTRAFLFLAATCAVSTIALISDSQAYPGDVFTAGAPLKGPSIQRATEIPTGTYSVSQSTGAAQYTFPIVVPPGRAGMAPSVALNYSSQNPLRGGIAAGWTLNTISIEIDTSGGRLRESSSSDRFLETIYKSGLAGGQRLVKVSEPGASSEWVTLRAENDAEYVRYEYPKIPERPSFWRALHPNGRIFYFGETPESRDGTRWFLTRVVDQFNNAIVYTYEKVRGNANSGETLGVPIDIALTSVEYTKSPIVHNAAHARVLFKYAEDSDKEVMPCPGSSIPRGARFTYRSGVRTYLGARLLKAISAQSWGIGGMKTRREVKLEYDQAALDCNQPRAPLRLITKIRETVWDLDGIAQDLPVILIDYGSPERTLEAIGQFSNPLPDLPHLGDGYRHLEPQDPGGWPTTQSTLLDLDGDGFLDWLSASNPLNCDVKWYRGIGTSFLNEANPRWPTLPWRNGSPSGAGIPSTGSSEIFSYKEGCSISYQLSRRETPVPGNTCRAIAANYSAFRLIDMNGDGVVELLSGTDYQKGKYNPLSDLTPGAAAVFYADRYGGAPVCPATPLRCRTPNDGKPELCSANHFPPTAFAPEEEAGTGPACSVSDQCRNPSCVCIECATTNWDVECPCSSAACSLPDQSLSDSIYARRSQGPSSSFFGPLFEGGDVGKETTAGMVGKNNVQCRYVPEHCVDDKGVAAAYIWRKYDLLRGDNSNSQFSKATLTYSPIPLESARATAAMGGTPASSFQAVVDIDGDACVDALFEWPRYRNGDGSLQVWRGDCTGGFLPKADGTPWIWQMPSVEHFQGTEGDPARIEYSSVTTINNSEFPHRRTTEVMASLTDINGDGLPDYVVQDWAGTDPDHDGNLDSDPTLRVFFNTGTGFEIKSTVLSDVEAVQGVQSARILKTMSEDTSVVLKEFAATKDLEIGWSKSTLRPFDFDYDGLVDVAQLPAPMAAQINPWSGADKSVIVHVNHGDHLRPVTSSKLTQQWHDGLSHITLSNRKRWRIASDARDLNNDGLPDNFPNTGESPPINAGCNPPVDSPETLSPEDTYSFCGLGRDVFGDKEDSAGAGLRFLRSIDNGRGAIVRFNYGTSGDPGLVKREAGSLVPNPLWVVRSVAVEPGKTASGEAALPSTTSYVYLFPVVNEDSRGHFGFRGFKQIEVLGTENATHQQARTVERYDYALDYSGRLTERLIFDQAGKLYSIDATTWKEANLFDEAVKIHLATDSRTYTCDTKTQALPTESQEADCKTRGALKRTTRNYRPKTSLSLSENGLVAGALPSGGVVGNEKPNTIMYVLRGERLTDSVDGVAVDDRGTVFGETVLYSQDRYQLLPTDTRRYSATQNSWTNPELVGRTQITYDGAGHGTPSKSSVWRTTTEVATTIIDYDFTTGNLKRTQKPKFNGTDLWTVTSYTDPFQMFPTEIRNEKGHLIGQKFDPHTGQVIRRENPKQSSGIPVELMRYDGLGRMVRVDRTTDPGFTVRQIRSVEYDDASIPNKVITRQKLDHAENTWVSRDATYDGLGRPLTERLQVDPTTWAVSSFGYDRAGRLVSFTTPSPTGVGNEIYQYQHDALGRITLSDAPGMADWTFKYDGLKVVREQVVTPAAPLGTVPMQGVDGSVAMTVQTGNDVFGRLREVTEFRNGPNAVTTYSYDANDHLTKIVDADGIKTDLAHDFVGNRIAIVRAGRTWSYGYDLNSNLNVETTPHTESPDQHVSTWKYDELDRLIEHNPARRGLSAEAERYSLGSTTYIYDDSSRPNGIGRLTTVKLPFGSVIYDYTVEGWVEREQRAFSIKPAGIALSDNREIFQTFNALGLPTFVKHADGATSTSHTYDFAGRPLASYLGSVSFPNKLAQFDRNLAGLPIVRFSAFSHGQSWKYDALGRVTDNIIRRCSSATTVADDNASRGCATTGSTIEGGEAFDWLETGNVRSARDRFTGVAIEYRYDSQHQITSATSSDAATTNPPTYTANLRYSPAGRIQHATILSGEDSPDVWSRDVDYIYDDGALPMLPRSDPAAVRELRPADSSDPKGLFTYDQVGNLTTRTQGNENLAFVYDGNDHLRNVSRIGAGNEGEIYYYDHIGQRVLAYSTTTGLQPGRLRFWVGAAELEYAVASSPGKTIDSQVFISLGAVPVARIVRNDEPSPKLSVLYSGIVGSLLSVLRADEEAQAVARFGYGPFGELIYAEGESVTDFHRLFNGTEHDSLTGLSYYGSRYYDRMTLNWTQFDPKFRFGIDSWLDQPRHLNAYAFSLQNPLRYFDPDGRDPMDLTPESELVFLEENQLIKVESVSSIQAVDLQSSTAGGAASVYGSLEAKLFFVNFGLGITGAGEKDELPGVGVSAMVGTGVSEWKAGGCLMGVCLGGEFSVGAQFGFELSGGKAKVAIGIGGGLEANYRPQVYLLRGLIQIVPGPYPVSDEEREMLHSDTVVKAHEDPIGKKVDRKKPKQKDLPPKKKADDCAAQCSQRHHGGAIPPK